MDRIAAAEQDGRLRENGTSMEMPLNPQCCVCKTEQGLSRCVGCDVVFYCGRDHQTAHWSKQKKACKQIKTTKNKLEAEIKTLNAKPSTSKFTEKPFENSVGHFWDIADTRTYTRVRHSHAGALLEIKNRTAVQTALDHLLDMLRLNRKDNSAYLLGVVEPDSHYNARPGMYAARDIPAMQIAVAQTYDAWLKTPGALAFLDQMLGGPPA
jgi:hypothetical protein